MCRHTVSFSSFSWCFFHCTNSDVLIHQDFKRRTKKNTHKHTLLVMTSICSIKRQIFGRNTGIERINKAVSDKANIYSSIFHLSFLNKKWKHQYFFAFARSVHTTVMLLFAFSPRNRTNVPYIR